MDPHSDRSGRDIVVAGTHRMYPFLIKTKEATGGVSSLIFAKREPTVTRNFLIFFPVGTEGVYAVALCRFRGSLHKPVRVINPKIMHAYSRESSNVSLPAPRELQAKSSKCFGAVIPLMKRRGQKHKPSSCEPSCEDNLRKFYIFQLLWPNRAVSLISPE